MDMSATVTIVKPAPRAKFRIAIPAFSFVWNDADNVDHEKESATREELQDLFDDELRTTHDGNAN